MKLKLSIIASWALCLAASSITSPAQPGDYSKVEIKVHHVEGPIYMLEGAGGNIGVSIGDDGIVMVDDQFAPLAEKIKAALKGLSDKPIRFVLNTHYHGDHTGGNAEFGTSATIVAHENVRKRLETGGKTLGNEVKPSPREALPVITFNDRASVHLNGEEIRALHFPHGHTDGDSMIYFTKSKVVHTGDDFVTYGFPFVDTQNGGSVSGMIAALEKALAMLPADIKVIPGHGAVSTPDDVRKFIKLLKDNRALVAKAKAQGKSAEDMKKAHLLADYEAQSKGFIKADAWIDTLYADVAAGESKKAL